MSGSVSTQVRGEGVVEAEDPYNIVLDETRKVKGVLKHVGDHVEIGDVIYNLEGESGEELTNAKNELEGLKSEYDLTIIDSGLTQTEVAAVEAGVTINSGTILTSLENKDKEITALKDQLKEKEKKYSEVEYQSSLLPSSDTVSDYSAEEKAVEDAENAYNDASNVLDSYEEAQKIIEAKNEAVSNYQTALEDYNKTDGVKAKYDAAETDYEAKKAAYLTAKADHDSKKADYDAKNQIYLDALNATPLDQTAVDNAKADADAAKSALEAAESAKNSAETAKDSSEKIYNECKDAKETALTAINTAKSAMEEAEKLEAVAPSAEEIQKAKDNKAAKEAALNKAKENLANKKKSDSGSNTKNKENSDSLKKQEHELSVEINDLKNKIEKLEAERDTYLNDEKTKITLESKYKEILKKEKEVKDLEDKAIGGEIKSPVAGIITETAFTSGERIESGSVVAVIQIDGKGYKLSFPVTSQQAKAVRVGAEVSVVNSWYYGDMDVNLVAIQPDKNNTRDGKLLVFSLSGDAVSPGQSLTLSVGEKSSNYDLIVPVSAVHEDNNGKFILIIDQRSTPFGTRYLAKRVDVKVLASDDKVAAVNGELLGYEYVITNSSKPLENKDQVKLAE